MKRLIWAAIAAATVLGAISLAANVVYGLNITLGLERWLYAVGGGISDLIKLTIPPALAYCIITRRVGRWSGPVAVGWFIWAVTSLYSLNAGAGLFEIVRANKIGAVEAQKSVVARLSLKEQALAVERTRLLGLDIREPLEAELSSLKLSKIWKRTSSCKDVTLDESRTYCSRVTELAGRVPGAMPALAHRTKLNALDGALRATQLDLSITDTATVHSASDPATASFVAALGITGSTLRAALALLFGLIFELCASLTSYVLAPGLIADKAPQPAEPEVIAGASKKPGLAVERWAVESLTTARGRKERAGVLYDSWRAWAKVHGLKIGTQRDFGISLTALGYRRHKNGHVSYLNVHLRAVGAELRLVG